MKIYFHMHAITSGWLSNNAELRLLLLKIGQKSQNMQA